MKRMRFLKKTVVTILALAMLIPVLAVCVSAASKDEELKEGKVVTFGAYEQDNVTLNGDEPIEWYVLYVDDDEEQALLISKYILFCGTYNDSWASKTWDECSLREWMNDVFYESAFSEDEQEAIKTTIVTKEKNPVYRTSAGEDTEDNVFILSIGEAKKFLKDEKLLKGIPTEYAAANGVRVSKDGTGWYWLRNPGKDRTMAAYVKTEVKINYKGVSLNYSDGGVRPAIWVDINKLG